MASYLVLLPSFLLYRQQMSLILRRLGVWYSQTFRAGHLFSCDLVGSTWYGFCNSRDNTKSYICILNLQISPHPPTVLISCINGPVRPHDSTVNIKTTKEFTVNIISEPFVHAANFTSIDAPEGHSEWRGSGLTMAPSVRAAGSTEPSARWTCRL